MDFVSHDIGKFLRLALKDNGYVLEQLLSPLVVETSDWHAELKDLTGGLITRRLYFHYRGFFANQEKIYHNSGLKKVKGLLYQYRVAMTGIHVLETGEINANVHQLNDKFRMSGVDELARIKASGEASALDNDATYLAQIHSLEPRLDEAYQRSQLPIEIPDQSRLQLEDFLIRCRRALGGDF
jgi:predicted nucleotidyltransferase